MKKWSYLLCIFLTFPILSGVISDQDKIKKINELIKESITAIQDQDYKQALIFIQKAKDLDTENTEIYQMEGQLLEILGRNMEAIAAWDNCLKYANSDSLKSEAEVHIKHLKD